MLLIGGPLAGAVLVWLAISIFSSKPAAPPEEPVAQRPAPELANEAQSGAQAPIEAPPAAETQPEADAQPAIEPEPAIEANAARPAEAEPEPAYEPTPVAQEPRPQPADAPSSATNEVTPKVPQSALNTISGTVRVSVRVTIDKEGAVIDAIAANPGPSRYFERLSVDAAKKWTFAPAASEAQRTTLVKFNFTRDGVTAQASE